MELKPIETKYKGCLFRSRLEARWAVFFDEMGIPWEYEKEGYNLPTVGWYLPDFWLPQQQCFFEVKGAEPNQVEKLKASNLSKVARKVVALASGTMGLEEAMGSCWLPISGYSLSLFAGEAWDIWDVAPHELDTWEWIMNIDLPPFIVSLDSECAQIDSKNEAERRKMINLDRQYYFSKYGREHPRYIQGRCVEASWKYDKSKGLYLVEGAGEGGGEKIHQAMEVARSARF